MLFRSPENKTSSDPNYRVTLIEVWDSRARASRRRQQTKIRGRMRSGPTPPEQRARSTPYGLSCNTSPSSKAATAKPSTKGFGIERPPQRRTRNKPDACARRHPFRGSLQAPGAAIPPRLCEPTPLPPWPYPRATAYFQCPQKHRTAQGRPQLDSSRDGPPRSCTPRAPFGISEASRNGNAFAMQPEATWW